MKDTESLLSWKTVLQLVVVMAVLPLLPMMISGKWDWWQAWAYAAALVIAFVASRVIAARVHPGIIKERADFMKHGDTKPFDKVILSLFSLLSVIAPVVAGLDRLFGWSPLLGPKVNLAALGVLIIGYALSSWALVANEFFSGTVRIQAERGHHVVSDGPYRFVRHPGYLGNILSNLSYPFLFDSVWAAIPMAIIIALMVVRTALEDGTLKRELPGYAEYAARTRYRLLPGIW